jgi:hypothetical protein
LSKKTAIYLTYCKAQISPGIFRQNANLTATVGTDPNAGGLLDNYWQTTGTLSAQNYVKESRVEFMRYVGKIIGAIHSRNPNFHIDEGI